MANYIFLKDTLEKNIFNLKNAFSEKNIKFGIFYSVKTNSSNEVLSIINKHGKFEIVSGYEWELIEKLFPTEIVINGPSKNLSTLEKIYKSNVQKIYFNIDNDTDLELLRICYEKFKSKLVVGIRVYCNKTGVWNRFGYDIDSERVNQILSEFKYTEGFHFHFSTNNFDITNYSLMLDKINHLINKLNLDIKYIDIGGGLPGANEVIYHNAIYKELPEVLKNKINSKQYGCY